MGAPFTASLELEVVKVVCLKVVALEGLGGEEEDDGVDRCGSVLPRAV